MVFPQVRCQYVLFTVLRVGIVKSLVLRSCTYVSSQMTTVVVWCLQWLVKRLMRSLVRGLTNEKEATRINLSLEYVQGHCCCHKYWMYSATVIISEVHTLYSFKPRICMAHMIRQLFSAWVWQKGLQFYLALVHLIHNRSELYLLPGSWCQISLYCLVTEARVR